MKIPVVIFTDFSGRIPIFRVRKLITMAIMLNIRIDKSQILS